MDSVARSLVLGASPGAADRSAPSTGRVGVAPTVGPSSDLGAQGRWPRTGRSLGVVVHRSDVALSGQCHQRHQHLVGGQGAVAAASRFSPVSAGSMKAIGRVGDQGHVPEPGRRARRSSGPPNQPSSTSCSRSIDPGACPRSARRRTCQQVVGGAGAGVQPAEPPSPEKNCTDGHDLPPEQLDPGPDVDLAVVGGDHQDGPGGQLGHQVADQPVDGPQLGVVVVAEPVAWATLSMPS